MLVELEFSRSIIPPTPINRETDSSFEEFQNTPFKFALQKDGELTQISLSALSGVVDSDLSDLLPSVGRRLFAVRGELGVALARNKAICQLVANGSVDAGIVGLDQVYESGLKDKLVVAQDLRHAGEWDIVLATPETEIYENIQNILVIATQYPVIAEAFFASIGHSPTIIKSQGSTEVMPLLMFGNQRIDGIVDLKVSGNTLAANGMRAWEPPITRVFPVLITNKDVLADSNKIKYLEKFIQG